jgi:uncharacterized protein (DUF849 family)
VLPRHVRQARGDVMLIVITTEIIALTFGLDSRLAQQAKG